MSIPAPPLPLPLPLHPTLTPSGPICAFGNRLAFTYFPSPTPSQDLLNSTTTTGTTTATGGNQVYWFTIDDQLVYLSFFQDYGPLNIGCLYRFCLHLHNLLEDPLHKHQRIFLYSSDEPDKKVNAALLMSLYAMVVMRWSVADVLHPISCLELQPYRDAGYSRSDYHLHPQQILYGLSRALSHQLIDLSTFDLAAYEKAEKVEEGDWNWITPGFIAFASPVEAGWNPSSQSGGAQGSSRGRLTRSFRNVLEEFEEKGVRAVVRLNKKLYDRNHFLERGIQHIEMYFDDGTNPTMEMCREFIDLSDEIIRAGGSVAVHCKAGLGRTGTLIGAYLIYKHGFTADEAIGFMRLMRPGSCVGPQQHFLYENQLEWVKWSARDELLRELKDQAQSQSQAPPQTQTQTQAQAQELEEKERERSRSCSVQLSEPRPITPPNEQELARNRSTTPHHHHPSQLVGNAPAPVTPRRQIVPGQPRKTPGRSRHGVAAPEEKDSPALTLTVDPVQVVEEEKMQEDQDPVVEEEDEEEKVLREEQEMEGVILTSSPRKKRTSLSAEKTRVSPRKSLQLVQDKEEEEEEEEEDPLTMMPSPKKLDLQPPPIPSTSNSSNNRPKTPSTTTTSSRPTRIARSAAAAAVPTQPVHQRALSAITDNRIVDRLRTNSNSNSTRSGASTAAQQQAIARSRGAKNLANVFEAHEQKTNSTTTSSSMATTRSSSSRYPLRNNPGAGGGGGRTSPNPNPSSSSASTTILPPNSPSKLPTRIPAKRQPPPASPTHHQTSFDPSSTSKEGGSGASGFSLKGALDKLGGGGGNKGRNVRRRRSSMGSQDFVQAG